MKKQLMQIINMINGKDIKVHYLLNNNWMMKTDKQMMLLIFAKEECKNVVFSKNKIR